MTDAEKLVKVKEKLNITDTSYDVKLASYLNSAKDEILNWMYINYSSIPSGTTMPAKYEHVQIEAVVVGFNIEGGENESSHTENGISRRFVFSNMIDFIHAHVYQII